MNIYLVDAGEFTDRGRYDPPEPPETWREMALVAAPTRRTAFSILWKAHRLSWYADYIEIPWRGRKVCEAERERGVLERTDDPIWELTCSEHWGKPCVCELLEIGPPEQCEGCGTFEGVGVTEFAMPRTEQIGKALCGSCLGKSLTA